MVYVEFIIMMVHLLEKNIMTMMNIKLNIKYFVCVLFCLLWFVYLFKKLNK